MSIFYRQTATLNCNAIYNKGYRLSLCILRGPWPEKVNVNYISTMDSTQGNRVGETIGQRQRKRQ